VEFLWNNQEFTFGNIQEFTGIIKNSHSGIFWDYLFKWLIRLHPCSQFLWLFFLVFQNFTTLLEVSNNFFLGIWHREAVELRELGLVFFPIFSIDPQLQCSKCNIGLSINQIKLDIRLFPISIFFHPKSL
jgi:hypothetical protein